jgi:peptidoglycan/LPS O-acetylase OafA/YrhL
MAAGLICRNLAERGEQTKQNLALALGVLGLVLIAATYARFNAAGGFDFDPKSPFWIVLPTIEALCYGAIVSAYIFLPRNASQALGFVSKAFGYLGRITYSMYLVHLLIFLVVWKLVPMSATTWEQAMLWFILVGLPAVILASSLTYAVVERPFLELERSDAASLAVWRALSGILVGTGLSNNLFRPQAERIRQRLAAAEAPAIAPAADGPDAGRG